MYLKYLFHKIPFKSFWFEGISTSSGICHSRGVHPTCFSRTIDGNSERHPDVSSRYVAPCRYHGSLFPLSTLPWPSTHVASLTCHLTSSWEQPAVTPSNIYENVWPDATNHTSIPRKRVVAASPGYHSCCRSPLIVIGSQWFVPWSTTPCQYYS